MNDTLLIIANVLSFIGNAFFSLSAILHSKKKIVISQSTNYVFAIVSEAMVGAYSALIQEASALIKNIVLLFVKEKEKLVRLIVSIICILAALIVGVIINVKYDDNVWYGYLPIIGALIYSSVVVFTFMKEMNITTTELILKIALVFNSILWSIYGFFVKLYPIMVFNIINLTLSIISVIRCIILINRENKKI